MDIEFTNITFPPQSIFKPIEDFPVSQLYQQQITLENSFSETPLTSQSSILLTFINNTLLLSNPQAIPVQPFAAVNLDFDIKF
jgi:hypothetical protein